MNVKEYLRLATDNLKNSNIETPVLEAGVILCHVLKCDRTYLYSHDDRVLKQEELEVLDSLIEKRAKNVPLQYLIGKTEFMSLPFVVSPAVLIPRQDTEILVEKCIELIDQRSRSAQGQELNTNSLESPDVTVKADRTFQYKMKVLDMCTGSGCIAISIAHYCPESTCVACDISQDALRIASINSELNGVQNRLELRLGDLFGALESESEQFDLIVSNPPYIETDVMSQLQAEVKDYEPQLALEGGLDGLDFYRRIIDTAPHYLNNGGYLAFEIGYNQGQRVSDLMKNSFEHIEVYKDICGNDRVVIGQVQSVRNS